MTPDEHRLEALARAHGPCVLAFLARRVTPREDAADLWQQTLTTVWRKITKVPRAEDEVLPWLITIAAANWPIIGAPKQRRLAATERLREVMTIGERTVYVIDGSGPDIHGGQLERVHEALAELGPTDREIVTRTYWDGLTSEQVGAVLGMRSATVRKRLQRCRGQLNAAIDDANDADEIEGTLRPQSQDPRVGAPQN